jgi:hypothetical protein
MADEEPKKRTIRPVVIKKADIPEALSTKAIERVNEGMDKFQIEKVSTSPSMCFIHSST